MIDPGVILSNHFLLTSRVNKYLLSDKSQEIFYIFEYIHYLYYLQYFQLCGISGEVKEDILKKVIWQSKNKIHYIKMQLNFALQGL